MKIFKITAGVYERWTPNVGLSAVYNVKHVLSCYKQYYEVPKQAEPFTLVEN